ncbi:MAG: flavodoxin family protein [Lentisphaeria bacterium]|nr:flavodoxin family protein [Lentisphaeria bacterium]
MKVVAFNGSPKANGNTAQAIKMVTDELEKAGVEVEVIHVGNKAIHGCMGCGKCYRTRDERCVIEDGDLVNGWIQKMKAADGIILGSPVYYASMTGTMKCFLDRAFYVMGVTSTLRGKVGASVVAVRRSGGMPTFDQLNNYLNYCEVTMPTSNYWNVIHGTKPGQVQEDAEGQQIMRLLGKNMLRTLKMVEYANRELPLEETERKVYTNFIR